MKQLTCEMCGSTELIKQDGLFVCQTCGCQYSVEEAKKMMIDGTVDVSGSVVRVDTSAELENLYQIARRARDDNDSENAAKYYDMIIVKDAHSWEAAFYIVYFKAKRCKFAGISSASDSVKNCIDSVLKLIKDYVVEGDAQIKAIQEVVAKCIEISNELYSFSKNVYNTIENSIRPQYKSLVVNNCVSAATILDVLDNDIKLVFDNLSELQECSVLLMKNEIVMYKGLIQYSICVSEMQNLIDRLEEELQEYDPSYQVSPPNTNTSTTNEANNSGCYVATCVYGSYDCPQVWTLRRYRDYTLAETWYGRAFIRMYYVVSPTLVKWFGHTKWFKKMWKGKLDRMVENLKADGVEDTPYTDKNW